tara:strand:- start:1342 stop:1638 length:297 start_codon:yes stop_codon:yes gene_type:complete
MATTNIEKQSFGQAGALLLTSNSHTFAREFCAITFLEDTTFDSNGLVWPELNIKADGTAEDNITAIGTGITFPKGLTIYGQFTSIALNSGKVLAYLSA